MIIVDISVPVLFKNYDFKLREDVPIVEVIKQICSILSEKENCIFSDQPKPYWLASVSKQCIFHKEKTLGDYGIRSGNQLLLI